MTVKERRRRGDPAIGVNGVEVKRGGTYAAVRCANPSCGQRLAFAEKGPGDELDRMGVQKIACPICKTEAQLGPSFVLFAE